MRNLSRLPALSLLAVLSLGAPALFAAGESDYGDDKGNETVENCPQGQVWDKRRKKCVPPQQGLLDDDSLYEAGRALARAERYDEAIAVLSLAADKNDPRILNYLGYAHRKAGRVLVGLGYYQEALRIDPNFTLVREYLGEAYLALGDLKAAKEQLAEIEKRCGLDCPEHADLAVEIMLHGG